MEKNIIETSGYVENLLFKLRLDEPQKRVKMLGHARNLIKMLKNSLSSHEYDSLMETTLKNYLNDAKQCQKRIQETELQLNIRNLIQDLESTVQSRTFLMYEGEKNGEQRFVCQNF